MLTRYCLVDLETIGAPDADQWLGEITAPSNYSKQETIDAYIAGERMKQLDRAGLDPDLCQICAVGYETELPLSQRVLLCGDVDAERAALETIWQLVGPTSPMVGYGLTWFDAGVLVRRSQLLGVRVPLGMYRQGKYRHDWIVELADYLTLNGMIEQKKGRGLDYHCRRFGIEVDDACTGKDVGRLWKDGAIDAVRNHCRADMVRVRKLAERLGVIAEVPALSEVAS